MKISSENIEENTKAQKAYHLLANNFNELYKQVRDCHEHIHEIAKLLCSNKSKLMKPDEIAKANGKLKKYAELLSYCEGHFNQLLPYAIEAESIIQESKLKYELGTVIEKIENKMDAATEILRELAPQMYAVKDIIKPRH